MQKKLLCLLIIFVIGAECSCFCQVNSDAILYANGVKNFNNENWQYASVYLFAFIQRNPNAFATDPSFKKEVTTAFDYSMSQLRAQVADAQKYIAQQSQPNSNNGIGSSQSGLSYKPPLRPANTVKLGN